MKCVLVIAGSDPSGGAGVQADLITLKDFNVPALSCITALTAQNEQKVLEIHPTPADLLTQQLAAACEGKEVGAVKIGMVANQSNVAALIFFLKTKRFSNIIIDPILHSSSGTPLLEKKAYTLFRQQLLPLATVVTPNIPEANALIGSNIYNEETQVKAAEKIYCDLIGLRGEKLAGKPLAVVVKGGHRKEEAVDILFEGSAPEFFRSPKIPGVSPRGTGCRFSTSIAAGLASGLSLKEAIQKAKRYLMHYIQGY